MHNAWGVLSVFEARGGISSALSLFWIPYNGKTESSSKNFQNIFIAAFNNIFMFINKGEELN